MGGVSEVGRCLGDVPVGSCSGMGPDLLTGWGY